MTDPRSLLEQYAEEQAEIWSRGDEAPKAFAALRAVLDLCHSDAAPASGRGYRLVSGEEIEAAISSALSPS